MAARTSESTVTIDSILDLVRERADEVERTRRLPDDLVAAIRQTGLNRMLLPTALGGAQAPVLDLAEVVEQIAAVDGSTAWCAVIGAGSNIFGGYLSEAGAREVFADPDQGSATMFAPAGRIADVGGRLVLNGRWPFTSNCLHSTWAGLGALIERPDGDGPDPVPRVVFVRMADLTIEDTWDSVGLRGTGSHDVTAHDVVVDPGQWATFTTTPWADGPLWRLPIHTALLPLLTTVPLGIARGAIDEVARQTREGRTARRGQLVDDPVAMAELATADARLRGARAALREAVSDARALAERGEPVPRTLQARIAVVSMEATDVAVETTSVAHRLGGGAAAYVGSPLLRSLNDIHAARQHQLYSHQHRPQLGRILAGVDATYPPFVL
jgi:indole-3-acetate monooxygenase